ncbi:MAG: NAD/NADP octopine/nopaline dehydrogenase family protein [Spirochaetia bacterium]|nr:NAD/NADP octopine/nopaline dehydrogenase family protein [Spirochaetia bacterium]
MKTGNKKISVIGNGPLSLSIAAIFSQRGGRVNYIDVQKDENAHKELQKAATVTVTGAKSFTAALDSVTRSFAKLPEAGIIAITVTPSVYEEVFPQIIENLTDHQQVIFFPASFGALAFKNKIYSRRNVPGNFTISEAVSYPWVCSQQGPAGICVQSVKDKLRLAVCPYEKRDEIVTMYNSYFSIFEGAANFLETSLDNINMILHPLPILLNISAAEEYTAEFRHYMDGFSPTIGMLLEEMDQERLELGRALGIQLIPTLRQLKDYYGDFDTTTIAGYVNRSDGPYIDVKGFGLKSRYITEDIPALVVATFNIARVLKVQVPIFELCLMVANSVCQTDFLAHGVSLHSIGLAGREKTDIISAINSL